MRLLPYTAQNAFCNVPPILFSLEVTCRALVFLEVHCDLYLFFFHISEISRRLTFELYQIFNFTSVEIFIDDL